jgi:lipopolysaccharide/colanic/teichoic acid biosynthesis glycosyltransferase
MDMMPITENKAGMNMEITRELAIGPAQVVRERKSGRLPVYELCKAVADRFLAFCAVVILSPVLAALALWVRADSPGGAIYRREQVGKDGKRFTAYKFRTMEVNNDDREYKAYLVKYIQDNSPYKVDEDGKGVFKVVDDPRVTGAGVFLRRTNLDELPQLFNVLKGEMSFVGPRPDIPFSVNMYQKWHYRRLEVIPGITGLWQVCGRKGVSFEEMVRLDIEYIEKRSLWLDMKIMLLTVGTILKGDGS